MQNLIYACKKWGRNYQTTFLEKWGSFDPLESTPCFLGHMTANIVNPDSGDQTT